MGKKFVTGWEEDFGKEPIFRITSFVNDPKRKEKEEIKSCPIWFNWINA